MNKKKKKLLLALLLLTGVVGVGSAVIGTTYALTRNKKTNSNENTEENLEDYKKSSKSKIENYSNLNDQTKNGLVAFINSLNSKEEINNILDLSLQYNSIVNKIISNVLNAQTVKETKKYTEANNKEEFDKFLSETEKFLKNNKLVSDVEQIKTLDFLNKINSTLVNLKDSEKKLNGSDEQNEEPVKEDETFKEDVERKLEINFNPNIETYDLKKFLYSASINKENQNIYLSHNDIENVNLTLEEVKIDSTNVNNLNLIYLAKSTTDSTKFAKVTKTINFSNDLNSKINTIKISNLDEIFNFSYDQFLDLYKSDLTNNFEKIKEIFVSKQKIVNNFFKYKIEETDNIFTANNKIALNIGFYVNDTKIKEIPLQTENSVQLKSDLLKNISITPKEIFTNSKFYREVKNYYDFSNSEDIKNYYANIKQINFFNMWLKNDLFSEVLKTFPEYSNKKIETALNSLTNPTNASANALTQEEINKVFDKIYKENLLFDIQKPEGVKVEIINYSNDLRYEVNGDSLFATFKIKVTKGEESTTFNYYLNNSKSDASDKDLRDEAKILEIVTEANKVTTNGKTTSTPSANLFWSNIEFKNPNINHTMFNAKDAKEALETSYKMPKIGKYEIFVKEVKDIVNNTGNTNGGQAKVFLWYKKNGIEAPLPKLNTTAFINSHLKTINFFKPLSFRDIKPINENEWFTQNDFTNKETIDENDKTIINQINSSNFDYRRVDGVIDKSQNLQFRVLDPKDIIEQKAFEALNFLLKFKNTNSDSSNSNDKNFSNLSNTGSANKDDADVSNKNSSVNGFFTSQTSIKNSNDSENNLNLVNIYNKYFIYFYDVRSTNEGSLTFKLGFINKENTEKRYTNNQDITLVNLTNDYKENLYPEIILNSIKYSDLNINTGNIQQISANDFKNKVNNHSNDLSNYVSLKTSEINYNNFKINTSNISIAEAKNIDNNSIYVKLQYTNPKNNNSIIKGNVWYKIKGFASSVNSKEELTFAKKELKTVFESSSEITREREVEPYQKDLLWSFDNQTEVASWTLKNKYIEKTFLSNNSTNRKIKFHLFGNTLVQNDQRLTNISSLDKGYNFEFNFEDLILGKEISFRQQTIIINKLNGGEHPRFYFVIKAKYQQNEGIKFTVELEDKNYKLLVGNPYKEAIIFKETQDETKFDKFNKNKAFLINNAGASISLNYTNTIEHEDFGQKTNLFSYKNLDYNQENQPITFFTPQEVILSNEYNPNQNVSYELHNGYKQDNEFLHKDWKDIPLVNNVRSRAIAYGFGSATMFAKVSSDPNDGKFYIITNNHVEAGKKYVFDDNNLPTEVTNKYIVKSSNNFDNNVEPGYSYWSGSNRISKATSGIIWTGLNQYDKNGNNNTAGNFVDMTVFVVDAFELIKEAQLEGKMDMVAYFKNWFTLPNTNLDYTGVEGAIFFGANLKNFAMNGFPYGKQSGYLINRAGSSSGNVGLSRQQGYTPTFFNNGNSGTGILGENNSYISTINSGASLTFLQSWNYETITHSYFGINWNNEDPLSLTNKRSLAAQILKLNVQKPFEYSVPWFFRKEK
ncbi:MGA_1079 family surface serine endopeptidase [Mycoplasma sp. Z386]